MHGNSSRVQGARGRPLFTAQAAAPAPEEMQGIAWSGSSGSNGSGTGGRSRARLATDAAVSIWKRASSRLFDLESKIVMQARLTAAPYHGCCCRPLPGDVQDSMQERRAVIGCTTLKWPSPPRAALQHDSCVVVQAEALELQTTKVKALKKGLEEQPGTGQERLQSQLAEESSALSSMQARSACPPLIPAQKTCMQGCRPPAEGLIRCWHGDDVPTGPAELADEGLHINGILCAAHTARPLRRRRRQAKAATKPGA